MATLTHPAPMHDIAAEAEPAAGTPRGSGFEVIVPLAAVYVVLLVLAPFIAHAFHHAAP